MQRGKGMTIEILGVYAVEVTVPAHLIEITMHDAQCEDLGSFTQELSDQPQSSWQVPWDERLLIADGTATVETADTKQQRIVFFFHYLDLAKPLITPVGPLRLPAPVTMPPRLGFVRYSSPC